MMHALRQVLAAAVVSGVTLLPMAAAAAHPGHTHTILGTITLTADSKVEVLDKNNEKTLFAITKTTKILIGKREGSQKDLKVGMRIAVDAEEEEGEKFVALKIQLPADK